MSKKTVMTISQYNYDKLQKVEGATMNDKVMNLFKIVEPFMPMVEYTEKNKSLKVEGSTREYVDGFRISLGESRDNILTRAFMILDEINKSSVESFWIPFLIKNPYNNLLVIDGQLEYNNRELSFNYRGNVYMGKLPPSYIVDGNDLTKELYLWYDNLNWNEIISLILYHKDGKHIINEKDFVLEVN